jgi:hypothetical protein
MKWISHRGILGVVVVLSAVAGFVVLLAWAGSKQTAVLVTFTKQSSEMERMEAIREVGGEVTMRLDEVDTWSVDISPPLGQKLKRLSSNQAVVDVAPVRVRRVQ